jgi:hypothetical protein
MNITNDKDNDFTEDEAKKINTFVSGGAVGLESVVKDEHKVNSLFGLYMAGKGYEEISKISRVKKDIVLYLSAKMKWYEKRMTYLEDIQRQMTQKLSHTRIESLNFITDLINCHHKYYGDEINKYLETNDRTIIENLDMKALGQYFKSIEILEKIINPTNINRGGTSGTTININAAGSKIDATNDTIEITPSNTGDILKALASIKDKKKKEENEI